MTFPKDVLVIDFEGLAEPVQVGAVRLDRETLEEKGSYRSYIWADMKGYVNETAGISQETLEGAPSPETVGGELLDRFGTDVILAAWVPAADLRNLAKLMEAAGRELWKTYDYHVLDIWSAAYVHLLKKGYTGPVTSGAMFNEFGVPARGKHDALEDCRIAADILRKLLS